MTGTSPIGQSFHAARARVSVVHADLLRPATRETLISIAVATLILGALIGSLAYLDFSWSRIIAGLSRFGYIIEFMFPPEPGSWSNVQLYLHALGETLAIAFIGTLGAAVLAFPLGFVAAKNVIANRIVHILSRRMFDTIRGVDVLIWALIWINVVGLGPFAGALAIITSDFGAFGKLFSEAIETADNRPVEGILSSGGSELQAVRFGLLPQILPVVLSQLLYYFESNTRSATVLGIVGAGGIGLPLSEMIRTDEWQHAAFVVLMLLVTVAAIDWVSARLRYAIIGTANTRTS